MENKNIIKVMALTEDIGGGFLPDLNEALERIHYDPERATAQDIKDLEKIRKLIQEANSIAAHTADRMACSI